jgi:hypothetical protein
MSEGLIIALSTVVASIVSVAISQLVSSFVARKKLPSEIEQIRVDSDLTEGEIIEKYQKIARDQAVDNIELSKQLKFKEEEKKELSASLKTLYEQMILLDNNHKKEIEDLKLSFEKERLENVAWREWAKRLVFQLQSWSIVPVPFDITEAKLKGLSLGDMGRSDGTKEPI